MPAHFAAHWQRRLTDGFPMLAAMQLQVVGDASAWQLQAPFLPNRNDHGTAFGGSLAMLAIIAGWMQAALLAGDGCDVVIQSSSFDFLAPLRSDLHASVQRVPEDDVQRYARALARGRPARLAVPVLLLAADGGVVGRFVGRYVATALPA
ncbi:MAG TPA: YiiD C-terminal domain-containing protein [Chitinolyticbacter sp.]|nr:YiiD C-terminal domain-containing protein [Chitinolyticbacter sp.]